MKNKPTHLIIVLTLFLMSCAEAQIDSKKLKQKVLEAKAYNKSEGLNTNVCVLIDMSIHSGKNRLYVYDLKKDTIIKTSTVSHGCCNYQANNDYTKESPKFNNIPNSHCSSLGKYKIGKRGWSNWGIHVNYKLHGLEKTNSKAYERYIVLHSWEGMKDEEVYPNGTPESWGCPMVSDDMMRYLDKKLKVQTKPVLLWIYQ